MWLVFEFMLKEDKERILEELQSYRHAELCISKAAVA
jgi:hypothetical protein